MNEENSRESLLAHRLKNNYHLLHRQYRLGRFEGYVGFIRKWRPCVTSEIEFYEMCKDDEAAKAGDLRFTDAIQDLYSLTTYLEANLINGDAILVLRCKCLIYEATDYSRNVPAELGNYFVQQIETFPHDSHEVERLAENLNGGEFRNKDERATVIKLLLVAGVCGINQLYRAHNPNSYHRAFRNLEKINKFIRDELPKQHEKPRQSFGITGLSQYWTGKVFAKKGMIRESRDAFRASTEAYVARLRQKEDYFRAGLITPAEYEAKIAITVRRAALIAALGDGQHYFATGQLIRALESLTLARAALTRNSGLVYLIYVDMLYWACHRAAKSSNASTIETCVRGLTECRRRFGKLIPDSEYFHQTSIQLALALLSRAQLTGDVDGSDYRDGLEYLDEAITYAKRPADSLTSLNPGLLASALITRSRYFSSKYGRDKKANADRSYKYLNEAKAAAGEARQVSYGMEILRSEASAILCNVFVDLAELDLRRRNDTFEHNFDMAFETLQSALTENQGQNVRNEAACYLYLTRLSLLSPTTKTAAHEYFAKWEKISSTVEHDDCKTMAKELRLKLGSRILVVKPKKSLTVKQWNRIVFDFLLDESLDEFVSAHHGRDYNDWQLKKFLTIYLKNRLGYEDKTITQWFKESNLLDEARRRLTDQPPAKIHWKNRNESEDEGGEITSAS